MRHTYFVHIGLGKTATTTLQKYVFKDIAAANGFQFFGIKSMRSYLRSLNQKSDHLSFSADSPSFISCEAFAGWDPENWAYFAERNRAHFGAESTILLIIREPGAYLRSVYLQSCVHMGNLLAPQDFFREQVRYETDIHETQFNISKYDYNALINLYKTRFDTVIVQKFEHLDELRFLTEHFEVSDVLKAKITQKLGGRQANKSYSQAAVDLTFKISGRREFGATFKRKIRHRLWRKFIQFGYDKAFNAKPFRLNMQELPMIDLDTLRTTYEALPAYQVIGQKQ